MTECLNEEMRDLLPVLAHGSLRPGEAARGRAHLADCAACSAEFALLQTSRVVLQASAPRVDTARIAAALAASTSGNPALRLVSGVPGEPGARATMPRRRRAVWMGRQYLAAAASLLIVASLSLPWLRGAFDGGPGVSVDTTLVVAPDTPMVPTGSAGAGLAVGDGLADLSDADLTALLDELDALEATIMSEPASLRQPIIDTPEGR